MRYETKNLVRFPRLRPCLLLVVVGLTLTCAPATEEATPDTAVTVFEGMRLIAGDGSAPIDDAAFIVENDRFTWVGRRSEFDVPTGASRIDLAGKTVMPAFVNTHMHLSSDREELIEQLRENAYYGAAAVVSLGTDAGDVPFQVRNEIVPGAARFLTAGRGITRPEPGRSEVPYWIDAEEDGRAAVRELAAQRVDVVKIWVDDRDGQYDKLTPELYGAIIDEAHRNGLRVAAHIFALEDAKGLLRAGVDVFAHGVRDQDVDEEFLTMIREHGDVVYVPNLPNPGIARDLSWLSGTVSPDEIARLESGLGDAAEPSEGFQIQARNLARITDAGVTIAFGTDGSLPWSAHLEMEEMVMSGMSPADVIVSATRNSARLMGLDDLGTIQVGRSADFIVLDANPLDDITHTRQIAAVYLRGVEVDR